MKTLSRTFLLGLFACLIAACNGRSGGTAVADTGTDTITERASLLTMVQHPGWVEAVIEVHDSWETPLCRLALVPREADSPEIPAEYTVVQVPLRRSVVASSVHSSAIVDLGRGDAIVGIADGNFLTDSDPMKARLDRGQIRDVGQSSAPSKEIILDLDADALLFSTFDGALFDHRSLPGVAVVPMNDYLETSPLGRAEWILLLGHLYGRPGQAREIYDQVCHNYDSIAAAVASRPGRRPTVLTELPYQGIWHVPAGQSYMAKMLADAGADYPWADTDGTGSIPLDEGGVIDRAINADYWLIKNYGPLTPAAIEDRAPRAHRFKAFPAGVRVCDSQQSPFFLDVAFHPDRILADMARVFAGEACDSNAYFRPLSH